MQRKNVMVELAEDEVLHMAYNGQVFLEIDNYRYIRHEDFYLPCVRGEEVNQNVFLIKSVRNYIQVAHRFQEVINKYHLYSKAELIESLKSANL